MSSGGLDPAPLQKQQDVDVMNVIVDVAQPAKVVRTSHLHTLVGHFLDSVIYVT